MGRSDVLVDGDWLQAHLDDPQVVVIEVDENSQDYYVNHLAGAIALDWQADLQDPLRRDFIDRAGFEWLMSEKGVSAEDTVILYGGNNNWFAAYAYWYFKVYGHRDVRLLDGGRKRWELDGRPLVSDPVLRPATDYVAQDADPSIRAFRDEVIASIGVKNIVDVRSPQEFSGQILAPAHFPQEQPQKGGHVPTAVNVPWSKAAAEDGTFRSVEELRALYAATGMDLSGEKDTIVYCRVGERSAHTWFVLRELLEQPRVKNYDGSWVEYGSLIGVPIEK
jgi:thiosulfate/3-mercaptopyruvate sulfurtransferase